MVGCCLGAGRGSGVIECSSMPIPERWPMDSSMLDRYCSPCYCGAMFYRDSRCGECAVLGQFLLGRREGGILVTIAAAPAKKSKRRNLIPVAGRRIAQAPRKRWAAAKAA
jgi:hypothetical protein